MRRRTLLRSTLATIGATATAGCLGYTVQSQEDVQRREEEIEELEDTVDEQEAELEDRQARIEELDAAIEEREQEIQALESREATASARADHLAAEVDALEREKASELYAVGHGHFEEAGSTYDSAESSASEESFDTASAQFALSYGQYLSARDAMERAAAVAGEQNLTAAQGTIDTSIDTVSDYAGATLNFANENLFRSRGEDATADDYQSDGIADLDAARDGTVASPDAVDSDLGL